jgi:hypothetical protein
MEYPKINSLWKRQGWYFDEKEKKNCDSSRQKDRQTFIQGDYACVEFGNIVFWDVEEKIDGTNIRIFYDEGNVRFGGRTKDAQIPTFLLDYLQAKFTQDLLHKVFPCKEEEPYPKVILFGEGYGPKIQSGGYYADEVGFCLFDVYVNGWWLEKNVVRHKIGLELGVPVPPFVGIMTELEIVDYIKSKPRSAFAQIEDHLIEGVVCRPNPLMLYRNGNPIMMKLKIKDNVQ